MKKLFDLRRDERGSAVIEFAIAVPVLISMIYGIFQVALLYQAQAGMQHALGEGARYASIYPTPSDAQIQAKVYDKVFGAGMGTFTVPTPVNAAGYKTLSVTYTTTPNFIFFSTSPITLTKSKKVYIAV